jgi:protein-L-isoaspartate(D-aspartate) O-methyltransferase
VGTLREMNAGNAADRVRWVHAALMAELVGSEGTVTMVDIDPDVTDRASGSLGEAGYSRVNVVLADAETGVSEHAPYDRIIVMAGAWDIPSVWVEQLADGGRIVVPLRMRGLTRSLALERDGNRLVSRSAMICGFVKMQGAGAYQERLLLLRCTEIRLRFDDGGPDDPHLLDGVLGTKRAEVWSGVTIGRAESFDTLQFWLAHDIAGILPSGSGRRAGQRSQSCDGMLEGAAGIALTRHTTAAPASRWDACLLISPPTLQTMHREGME